MTATELAAPPLPSWPPRPDAHREDEGWSLQRWILVVGAITLVFAIAAVGLGLLALTRLDHARSVVVTEIHPALLASKDLSAALLGQQAAVRGYSLTGDDEVLAPYSDAIGVQDQAVAELRRLAAAEHLDELSAKVDTVLRLTQTWREEFATPTIEGVKAAGGPAAPVEPEVGMAAFEAAQAAQADIQDDLNGELAAATTRLYDAANFLLIVFVAIAVGLAALLIAVGVWLRYAVIMPLSGLADEVRLVVSGDAHREVHGRGPREVVSLAGDIDAMRRHILAELDALEVIHRRLDEQARDLERSNRDLEQFAYVASHDLQEPLRKVSSFCQLLKRRYAGQLDERADSYIAFAVDGASRMQRLINDLLAFSRVGRLTSGMATVELNDIVDAALSQLAAVCEDADAQITVEALPAVYGEASLLTQLFANLVGNALKFRRPDVRPAVTIGAQPHEDGWEIHLADNGIGIEPEYTDKVFVIFQRLHSREAYPGTGIGLAMAKKIVEYHGGNIWFDPDRADGATVRFTLPARPENDREEPES